MIVKVQPQGVAEHLLALALHWRCIAVAYKSVAYKKSVCSVETKMI